VFYLSHVIDFDASKIVFKFLKLKIKSEEKGFRPVEVTENFFELLNVVSIQDFFPASFRSTVVEYLTLR
jgi:hypothetical protein